MYIHCDLAITFLKFILQLNFSHRGNDTYNYCTAALFVKNTGSELEIHHRGLVKWSKVRADGRTPWNYSRDCQTKRSPRFTVLWEEQVQNCVWLPFIHKTTEEKELKWIYRFTHSQSKFHRFLYGKNWQTDSKIQVEMPRT